MSVLLLVLLLLLIAINGFFVAAEFALVRTRRGKIEQLAEEGESGAEAVVEQLDKIEESLSACQIGVTIASIGIGFLGEPSLSKLIEPLFGVNPGDLEEHHTAEASWERLPKSGSI